MLDPDFVVEYWHALLTGYGELYKGLRAGKPDSASQWCDARANHTFLNEQERVCMRGVDGTCGLYGKLDQLDRTPNEAWVPLGSPAEMATDCNTTEGMQRMYRRFTRVAPIRLAGRRNPPADAKAALEMFLRGSFKKAKRRNVHDKKTAEAKAEYSSFIQD